MPRTHVVSIFLLVALAWDHSIAAEFPYTATVVKLNVTARSGPSYAAYPTEKLPKHSQVEVYEEGAGGWVAIRPPREAFDWLPATAVKRTADKKIAVVLADNTPCHIGSNVKRVSEHIEQVTLKAGEQVIVLAEKSVPQADGSTLAWLKIAPPAGEFRWVQAKHLSTKPPEQLAAEESADRLAREERYRRENAENPPGLLARAMKEDGTEPNESVAQRDDKVEPAQFFRRKPLFAPKSKTATTKPSDDAAIEGLVIEDGQPSEAPVASAHEENAARSRISLDPAGVPADDPNRDIVGSAKSEMPLAPAPVRKVVEKGPPLDAATFRELLSELIVDLTVMVAEDSSKWNLTSLRQRATALVEDGPSPRERGRARLVLDRISEFEATLPPGQEEGLALPSPVTNAAAPVAAPKPEFETQYDAVGYLMPVIGARPGVPPFQLTDKDGRTLQYVSPAPGVNLNRYVKKQVGLYGQQGYVESLKKRHVTAQRVVDLDRHQR